mmetsp:Transcript_3574/g.4956  ORF Transcript_3574/g.4956 Transcript_3574/m.4956 type:complete len:178 (+) Transcript_3574:287-820(+)
MNKQKLEKKIIPYKSKTLSKVSTTMNPFNIFEPQSIAKTPPIQPKIEPTYPKSAPLSSRYDPIDLMTTLDPSTQSHKPVLPLYNPKYSYKKWQWLCLPEFATSKSKYYKSFVISKKMVILFYPAMLQDKKSNLFALLNKVIKPEDLEFSTIQLFQGQMVLSFGNCVSLGMLHVKNLH